MVLRLPSLNGLRAFEAAARHLSFTKAASELNVTQTAVSHQIRRLEEQLGLKLFHRVNRGLALSDEGEAYLPAIRAAFDDLRRATERLTRADEPNHITVSTMTSLAAKWLVPQLSDFQDAHPDVEVRITTSTALVDFHRDKVDMAIRYGHGNWPGLRIDWLMSEDIFPVCSPKLLQGAHPLLQPADLAHHTLLHVTGFHDGWRLWFTAADVPQVQGARNLSFDLSMVAYQAAIDGLGVALGRTQLVAGDLAAGRLIVPFKVSMHADAGFYVVAPLESAERPKVRLFRDWLLGRAAGGHGLDATP